MYDAFHRSTTPLIKQQIALLLVLAKAPKWDEKIDNYIVSLRKDPFSLFELVCELRAQYTYGFASNSALSAIARLTKKSLAKHELGIKNSSLEH